MSEPKEADSKDRSDVASSETAEHGETMIDDVQDDDQEPAVDGLEQLRTELDEATKLHLRSQAELENFRKRMRRDMEDERKYASLPLMRDLLAVVDNIQRAIESSAESDDASGLLDGVKLVAGQLATILEQHNCKRIETLGAPFDPNLHEAIGQEPSEEHAANTVVKEVQVGYQLHDRVIRPAIVFVSSGPPES